MTDEFFAVSPTSKNFLAQACSQGLSIDKYPPIQIVVHFQGDSIFQSKLSLAPVFSCLFLGYGAHKAMENLVLWCEAYAKKIPFLLSYLDLSAFKENQLAILKTVSKIPFGTRNTYQEIAELSRVKAEEVLFTCKNNPLPLLIPCHRVLPMHDYPGGDTLYKILCQFEGIF